MTICSVTKLCYAIGAEPPPLPPSFLLMFSLEMTPHNPLFHQCVLPESETHSQVSSLIIEANRPLTHVIVIVFVVKCVFSKGHVLDHNNS